MPFRAVNGFNTRVAFNDVASNSTLSLGAILAFLSNVAFLHILCFNRNPNPNPVNLNAKNREYAK